MQIMIKAKLTKRGDYQRDWLNHNCEDYFGFDFSEAQPTDKTFSTLVVISNPRQQRVSDLKQRMGFVKLASVFAI
jgi:hypothetical protein